MSDTKHTPGPWSLSSIGCTNDGNTIIVTGTPGSDDRKPVSHALCQSKYKRGEGWKAQCAERDANARLIAAAPAMYEALKALIGEYGGTISVTTDSPLAIAARAAIAQADGEAK